MRIVRDPAELDPWFDAVDAPARVRAEVAAALSGPDRHWHGLTHHLLMLESVSAAAPSPAARGRLIWATLLHDLIYDATASDNEERSASRARALVPAADRDAVAAMIVATQRHDLAAADAETRILLTADLSVLWSAPDLYAFYAHGIRAEYAHVPAAAYRAGRAAVLAHLGQALATELTGAGAAALARNLDWERAELAARRLDGGTAA
jgi:predicted metal-dependent HD superfamily phosphohydrolase